MDTSWPSTADGSPDSIRPMTFGRLGVAAGHALDWLVLLGVLGLIANTAFQGLVFLPEAGFPTRVPLAAFERMTALIGACALIRWLLLGARVLPGALLGGLSVITALGLLAVATTTDLFGTRDAVLFLASAVVVALAVMIAATDGLKTRAFLAGLVLVSLGESIIGLGQYAGGVATPVYWLSRAFAGAIRTRIHGTLGNPNVLASFLLIGIGATALLAVDLTGRKRLFLLAAVCVEVAALALTYSRGGYAGLGAFAILGAALLWPVRRRAWPTLLTIAAITVVAALALPSVGLRAGSVTLDEGDTAQSRLFIWRTAIRMWDAHRLWGTGLGSFNAAYSPYRPPGVMTTYAALRVPGSAHNDYLQLIAEIGLAGAGLIVFAVAWGVWRAARRYRTGSDTDRIWLGAWAASIGGIGVVSLANSTISVIPSAIMIAALTAAVAAHESLDHPRLRFHKRLLSLPLAAALIGIPPLLSPLVQSSAYREEAVHDVRAGRYADAVDAFRRAAAVDPLNGDVLPYFGDLLADLYLRRIDTSMGPWQAARAEAAMLYDQAQRVSPWDGYPRAALGRLRRAEGRYADAVAAFRDAIALDPYSPRYRLWLGETFAEMGDRRWAAEQLREAVRLYPIEMLVIERHEGHSAWYGRDQADLAQAHRLLSRVGAMPP